MASSFVFFTRSSSNFLVKSNLKKKIWVAFSGTSIFNPICSLNEKSFIVGGSSFQISERGSSTSESELGEFGELISASDILEASRLFGGRLCEVPRVRGAYSTSSSSSSYSNSQKLSSFIIASQASAAVYRHAIFLEKTKFKPSRASKKQKETKNVDGTFKAYVPSYVLVSLSYNDFQNFFSDV